MKSVRDVGVLAALLVLGAGCASQIGAAPASTVPALTADQVASTVETEVRAPIEAVFDYVVREDTPARDLRGYGLVDGVQGDRRLTAGGWDHPGARRVVVLEGGSTLVEQIERLDRPHHFRYRVSDFSFVLRHLATEGRGYWELLPEAAGTRVRWTYVLTAKSCEARPALRAAVDAFFEPYMRQGLASIRRHIEAGE